jgi:hypothetical protein
VPRRSTAWKERKLVKEEAEEEGGELLIYIG